MPPAPSSKHNAPSLPRQEATLVAVLNEKGRELEQQISRQKIELDAERAQLTAQREQLDAAQKQLAAEFAAGREDISC